MVSFFVGKAHSLASSKSSWLCRLPRSSLGLVHGVDMNASLEVDAFRIEHPGARYHPFRCKIRVNIECDFAERRIEPKNHGHHAIAPLNAAIRKPGQHRRTILMVGREIGQS